MIAAAWMFSACAPKVGGSDLGASVPDMSVVDASPETTCGSIVLCIIGCGLGKLACNTQCLAGTNLNEAEKAGTLALCAAEHCLSTDGGTDILSTIGCLLSNCPTQVAACDGLPL